MTKNKLYILIILLSINLFIVYSLIFSSVQSNFQLEKKVISILNENKIDYKKIGQKLHRLYKIDSNIDYNNNVMIITSHSLKLKYIDDILSILLSKQINIKTINIKTIKNNIVDIKIISSLKEQ